MRYKISDEKIFGDEVIIVAENLLEIYVLNNYYRLDCKVHFTKTVSCKINELMKVNCKSNCQWVFNSLSFFMTCRSNAPSPEATVTPGWEYCVCLFLCWVRDS